MTRMKKVARRVILIGCVAGAAVGIAIPLEGAAMAGTTFPSIPSGLPSDKAALMKAQQDALLAGRQSPAPKVQSAQRNAAATPSEAPESGIENSRQAPFSSQTFAVENAWTGEVGGQYFTVYAGVANYGDSGRAPAAGVVIYSDPANIDGSSSPTLQGTYLSNTGSSPLRITTASGGVLSLAGVDGTSVSFDVASDTYF